MEKRQRKVVIVGGQGAMGQLFSRWLRASGHSCCSLETGDWPSASKILQGADLVMVAVPIDVTIAAIGQLRGLLDPTTALCDLTSIKRGPVEAMLNAHAGPVIGLHPMFGPTTNDINNEVIVYCPARKPSSIHWFFDEWTARGGRLLESTAQEHDHMMATIQAARHFSTYAFGCHLHNEDLDLERTLAFSSPIYRLELGMVGRLFAQDPELYADIIYRSREGLQILRRYHAFFGELLAELECGNRDQFIARFQETRSWFGNLADHFLDESSRLLNAASDHRGRGETDAGQGSVDPGDRHEG